MEVNKKDVWTGNHSGIPWEIQHWGVGTMNDGKGMWNYYVYLTDFGPLKPIFGEIWTKPEDAFDYGILDACEFHGGITLHEKTILFSTTEIRSIKVGCDYGHLQDSRLNYNYSYEHVLAECLITIDKIIELI